MLLVLPLVLQEIGVAHFAAFLAITASTQWISPLGLGIMPSLTRELAMAQNSADRSAEKNLFGGSFWIVLLLASFAFLLGMCIAFWKDPRQLLGIAETVATPEARLGFALALGLVATNLFATLSTAVRAGYQESHVSNMLALLANLATIVGVFAMARGTFQLPFYIMMLQAPIVLLLLADIGRIMIKRPYLWPPLWQGWHAYFEGDLRKLVTASGASWAYQIYYFVGMFLSVVLVSRWFEVADTNAFGVMMRATILANSIIGLFAWPIIPALADAWRCDDRTWAHACANRLLGSTLAVTIAGAFVILLLGPVIIRFWMGGAIEVPREMALGFALLFVSYNMAFVSFSMLLATGDEQGVGWSLLAEILLVLVLAMVLGRLLGASGVALALGLAATALNGWILPLRLRRHLALGDRQ